MIQLSVPARRRHPVCQAAGQLLVTHWLLVTHHGSAMNRMSNRHGVRSVCGFDGPSLLFINLEKV